MAELVDAADSKSASRKGVLVRFRLGAPKTKAVRLFFIAPTSEANQGGSES